MRYLARESRIKPDDARVAKQPNNVLVECHAPLPHIGIVKTLSQLYAEVRKRKHAPLQSQNGLSEPLSCLPRVASEAPHAKVSRSERYKCLRLEVTEHVQQRHKNHPVQLT